MRKSVLVALMVLSFCPGLTTEKAEACAIPVFRYALEKWEPYPYEAIVFHKDPLTPAISNTLAKLEESNANLAVWLTDLADEMPEELKKLWEREKPKAKLPWVVVRYPYAFWEALKRDTLWSGPLEAGVIERLTDSPLRTQLARDMMSGVSAVWILVESGDKKVDDAKAKVLTDRLNLIKKEVELPEESIQEVSESDMAGIVPLKIDFKVRRVSRQDSTEKLFVNMLLMTEPDFKKHVDKPVVFPVFGQGRAIWGLVGDGINDEMIDAACGFMLGFCSCEIKDLNPGTDMLINADWYSAVTNLMSVPDEAPPLIGVTTEEPKQKAKEQPERTPETKRVMVGVGVAFGALLVIVAVVTAVIAGRSKE